MTLSNHEKETVIRWDEADKEATVEVPVGSRLHKRLVGYGLKPTEEFIYRKKVTSEVFIIPEKWVKINKPREVSEKERVRLVEMAKKNFGK